MLTPEAVARAILDGGADAVVAADRDGTIRTWNAGAERMFGYAPAEAIGQSLDLIIPERLRARHWAGWQNVMRTGRSRYAAGWLLSAPGLRKDGAQVSLEFTVVPVKDADGGVIGMAAILRDVTARFEEMRALRARVAGAAAATASGA